MDNNNRKVSITLSTILILRGILNLIYIAIAIINIGFLYWWLFKFGFEKNILWLNLTNVKMIINSILIYSIISLLVNIFLTFKTITLLFKNSDYFKYNKTILILYITLSFMFGGIIAGVLAYISLYHLPKKVYNNNNQPLEIDEENLSKLSKDQALLLARINEYYENKIINQIQYQDLISKTINSVNMDSEDFDFDEFYNQKLKENNQDNQQTETQDIKNDIIDNTALDAQLDGFVDEYGNYYSIDEVELLLNYYEEQNKLIENDTTTLYENNNTLAENDSNKNKTKSKKTKENRQN